ncbi:hypothetical protein ACGYJ8_15380 [Sulfitobacter sp. 1A12126]|uniref:hypothetical protein n=1 Tax=Sulfitobacter sp. 1A12126 TaxID=3368591 RepID=UPI003745B03B
MTFFQLLRGAGIDPLGEDFKASPFVSEAATRTAEIIRDTRNGDLWHLDMTDDAPDGDGLHDAPARKASEQEVEDMHLQRSREGAPSMRGFADYDREQRKV